MAVPAHGEARVGVEVGFLFPQDLIEGAVDEFQGFARPDVTAAGRAHARVAGEHGDARPDGCLRQVDGGDVPLHERAQGTRELGFHALNEGSLGGGGRVAWSGTTGQDDRGGQGVGPLGEHPVRQFAAHRPRGRDLPARANEAVKQGMPPCGRLPIRAVVLLLVGVVHGHRHVRVGAVAYPVEDGVEAVYEKLGGILLPVVAVGVRHELLGLRREHGGDHRGVDALEAAPQPHVEEVGEVGVADIVVVGRVGGHHEARIVARVGAQLPRVPRAVRRDALDGLGDPLELTEEIPRGL